MAAETEAQGVWQKQSPTYVERLVDHPQAPPGIDVLKPSIPQLFNLAIPYTDYGRQREGDDVAKMNRLVAKDMEMVLRKSIRKEIGKLHAEVHSLKEMVERLHETLCVI